MTYTIRRELEKLGALRRGDTGLEWITEPLCGITGSVVPLAFDENVTAREVVELVFHGENRVLVAVTGLPDTADRCARVIGDVTRSFVSADLG